MKQQRTNPDPKRQDFNIRCWFVNNILFVLLKAKKRQKGTKGMSFSIKKNDY